MAVTADQVATLRAYLSGDIEEFHRLSRSLDRSRAGTVSYAALITAAFVKAVERRFNEQTPRSEVIDFVADIRSRNADVADELDPDKAKRLIMAVIADDNVDDMSGNERIGLQMIILAGLVADERFGEAEREEFLEKSRAFANELLG